MPDQVKSPVDQSVTLAGVRMKNPVVVASGTFGFGEEYGAFYDLSQLGGICAKGLTLNPREGNPAPRIAETPMGILNSVGLQNPGVDAFIAHELPFLRNFDVKVIANISGNTPEEYGIMCEKLAGAGVDMIEVNISCPNTMAGEPFNQSPEALDKLFTELDKIDRPQPTLVKMPLNKTWPEFKDLLDVLAEHNVQGLSIANLQKDRTGMSIPRDWEGGLSGSPCYATSNERIKQVYREYGDRFAIAGIGGVFTPQQAYEKIRCGSSLVMFISALMYRGPQQITVLKRGLAELLRRDGFEHVSEAVGIDA